MDFMRNSLMRECFLNVKESNGGTALQFLLVLSSLL